MSKASRVVGQSTATALAAIGYSEQTPFIWESYNPRTRMGGKPTDPEHAWGVFKAKRHYDTTCCIAAPTKWQAVRFLLSYTFATLLAKTTIIPTKEGKHE